MNLRKVRTLREVELKSNTVTLSVNAVSRDMRNGESDGPTRKMGCVHVRCILTLHSSSCVETSVLFILCQVNKIGTQWRLIALLAVARANTIKAKGTHFVAETSGSAEIYDFFILPYDVF